MDFKKMKKLLFLALLSVLSLPIYSQGNLQFNQVVQESFSPSVTSNTLTTIGTITVPTGKVWKIESAVLSWTETAGTTNSSFRLFIAGHCTWALYLANTGDIGIDRQTAPLWLKAGTYQIQVFQKSSFSNLPMNASYSGIEFNITP
jgi:hypothetical protein